MRCKLVLAGAVVALSLFLAPVAQAAPMTFSVTSTSDTMAGDPTPADLTCDTAPASPAHGACTLRAAIDTINHQPTGSGPYTISVPSGHYQLTDRYEISKDAVIAGADASAAIIDGQNLHNPFFIDSAGLNVTITGVEITGGKSFPRGGGVYNYGNLTLIGDWITGNTASDQGGGVFNNGGAVAIYDSTISGNAAGNGAGVNTGALGGASQGTLRVVNSTIAGNVAVTDGGGIRALNDTGTTLINDTIANNSAGAAGGGLDTETPSGPITLQNTIVAGNTTTGAPSDCAVAGGAITSAGHNLDQSGTCHLAGTGDRSGTALLGPLQTNGGPTPTRALLPGSQAIDAGASVVCPAIDQRGVRRPQGTGCDIGAYESAPPSANTGRASPVRARTAKLHGTAANPDVQTGIVFFQYGTSTAYGKTTSPQRLGAGAPTSAFSTLVSKLAPRTSYHFRLVAVNPDGTVFGHDATLRTTRRSPRGLSHRVVPKHATSFPYRYSFSGLLSRPRGVSRKAGCRGTITVRIKRGKRTVGRGHVSLGSACKYRLSVSIASRKHLAQRGTLQVTLRFGGNPVLAPLSARSFTIRYG